MTKTRRSTRTQLLRRLIRLAAACLSLSLCQVPLAMAQTTCPGGAPGQGGFLIKKASAGVSALDATQEQRTVSVQFIPIVNWNVGTESDPACGWSYQRLRVDASVGYDGKRNAAGALTVTRNHRLLVQHMMFLTSNALYAYVSGDLTHNNSLGVKFNQAYAGGLGYARGLYEVSVDVRFIDEKLYGVDPDAHLVGLGLSGRYDVPLDVMLAGATLSFAEVAVPVFNRSDSWMNNASIDLSLPFTTKKATWGVTLSVQDNYLDNAPPNFKKNYFRTSVNLTYSSK